MFTMRILRVHINFPLVLLLVLAIVVFVEELVRETMSWNLGSAAFLFINFAIINLIVYELVRDFWERYRRSGKRQKNGTGL